MISEFETDLHELFSEGHSYLDQNQWSLAFNKYNEKLKELREIFCEKDEDFLKFRRRLIELILAKISDLIFPQVNKQYLTVLNYLVKMNSIDIVDSKTDCLLALHRSLYYVSNNCPLKAETLLDEAEKKEDRDDRYLQNLITYIRGLIESSLNRHSSANISFLGLIVQIRNLEKDLSSGQEAQLTDPLPALEHSRDDSLPPAQELVRRPQRKFYLLLLLSYLKAGTSFKAQRFYPDSSKYLQEGLTLFEEELPEHQEDPEFLAIQEELARAAAELSEACNRQTRIEAKLSKMKTPVPKKLKPRKACDYKEVGLYNQEDSQLPEEANPQPPNTEENMKTFEEEVVDPQVGIKMQNKMGYRFYQPLVKYQDRWSLEHDKKTREWLSLTKSGAQARKSPYESKEEQRAKQNRGHALPRDSSAPEYRQLVSYAPVSESEGLAQDIRRVNQEIIDN